MLFSENWHFMSFFLQNWRFACVLMSREAAQNIQRVKGDFQTLLQVLSPSNWCESSKLLFHLVWGGHYHKYIVLVTCVKVI